MSKGPWIAIVAVAGLMMSPLTVSPAWGQIGGIKLPKPPKIDLPKPPKIDLPKPPKIDLPRPPRVDLSVEAWGEAGRAAYTAAAGTMRTRNARKVGVALTQREQKLLRPYFGSLVGQVRIFFGASPLNEWKAAGKTIKLAGEEADAQTYGYNIYVKNQRRSMTEKQWMSLLAHELMHVKQYERYGKSLSNFGYHYFKEYKKAGLKYDKNKLEQEADRESTRVMQHLAPALR